MNEKVLHKIDALLGQKLDRELSQFLVHQDAQTIADTIDRLTYGKRKVFALLPPETQAIIALMFSEQSKQKVISRLPEAMVARFLHFMNEDDATDILQYFTPERRTTILEKMQEEKRRKIEKLLKFGSETAGGLMDLNFITVPSTASLKESTDKVKESLALQKQAPIVIVMGSTDSPLGYISHRSLLFASPTTTVPQVTRSLPLIQHTLDREKILEMASKTQGEIFGVTDEGGHVLGIIHVRDLLKVAQAEATEDIYRFAGVDLEERALDSVAVKVRRRSNWLIINLVTAFLATTVVSLFQDSIGQLTLLAVYMPMVAGVGGNAASQTLAVVVRGLATGDIHWPQAKRVVFREAATGITNGAIVGTIAALTATLYNAPPLLGLVLGTAMVLNLGVAGLFGALVPFVLKKNHIDPAIASSIFVTAVTDIFGFLTFLGLGTALLL